MESYLKNAVGRDVVAMAVRRLRASARCSTVRVRRIRACGVRHPRPRDRRVCVVDGVLAHNPEDVREGGTWAYPRWENHGLPRLPMLDGEVDPTEEEWDRWAERVEHYLSRVEAVCTPDNFIICGRASVSFDKWAYKMKELKTPVICAEQGLSAAVQGAAQGASAILTLRRDTARAPPPSVTQRKIASEAHRRAAEQRFHGV